VDPRSDLWLPLDNLTEVEPRSGDDIVTTIDVNLQDIAEQALLRGMRRHQPDWGTAIVMDVETGAIRAMANLGRDEAGQGYYEMYNYAIAMATEPGSTFKLASIMALLEDGHVDLSDSVNVERGKTIFYDQEMEDSSTRSFKMDSTTVQNAFEISSNVGIAKLVDRYYNLPDNGNKNKGAYQFIAIGLLCPLLILIGARVQPGSLWLTGVCERLGLISFPLYCVHEPVRHLTGVLLRRTGLTDIPTELRVTLTVILALLVSIGLLWLLGQFQARRRLSASLKPFLG